MSDISPQESMTLPDGMIAVVRAFAQTADEMQGDLVIEIQCDGSPVEVWRPGIVHASRIRQGSVQETAQAGANPMTLEQLEALRDEAQAKVGVRYFDRIAHHLSEAAWWLRLHTAVEESTAIMVAAGFDPVTRTWPTRSGETQ